MVTVDKKTFTKKEIMYVKDNYKRRTNRQLAKSLGRCEDHITYLLDRLNLVKRWTKEEDELLKRAYPILPLSFIEEALNRTRKSIVSRATRLGIRRGKVINISTNKNKHKNEYNLEVIKVRRDVKMIRPKEGEFYKLIRHNASRNSAETNTKIFGRESIVKVLKVYSNFVLLEHRNGLKESINKVDLYIKEYELEELKNE